MCNIRELIGDCNFSIPGIKKIELAEFRENLILDKVGDFFILTTPIVWANQEWFDADMTKLTQDLVRDKNDKYYKITLEMGFNPIQGKFNKELKIWADTRLMAKITDRNDRIWLVGAERGLFMTQREDTTGTRIDGRNRYNLVFEGVGLGGFLELEPDPIDPIPTDYLWKHISIHYRGTDTIKTFYIPDTGITDIQMIEVLTDTLFGLVFDYVPDGSGGDPSGDCEGGSGGVGALYGVPFSSVQTAVHADNLPFTLTIYFDAWASLIREGSFLLKYRVPGVAPIIQDLKHTFLGFGRETLVAYEDKITILTEPKRQPTVAFPGWIPYPGHNRTDWKASLRVSLSGDFSDFLFENDLAGLNAAILALPPKTNYAIHWCLIGQLQGAAPFGANITFLQDEPILEYTWDYISRDDIEYLYHIDDSDNNTHRPFEDNNTWMWDGTGLPSIMSTDSMLGDNWVRPDNVITQQTEMYIQTVFKLKGNIPPANSWMIFNDIANPNGYGGGLLEGFFYTLFTPYGSGNTYGRLAMGYAMKNPYGYNAPTFGSSAGFSTVPIYDLSKPTFVQIVFRSVGSLPSNTIPSDNVDFYVNGLKHTVANGLLNFSYQGVGQTNPDWVRPVREECFGTRAAEFTVDQQKSMYVGGFYAQPPTTPIWGSSAVKVARMGINKGQPTVRTLRYDYNQGEFTPIPSEPQLILIEPTSVVDAPTIPSPIDAPTLGTTNGISDDAGTNYRMRHWNGAKYEPFNL